MKDWIDGLIDLVSLHLSFLAALYFFPWALLALRLYHDFADQRTILRTGETSDTFFAQVLKQCDPFAIKLPSGEELVVCGCISSVCQLVE